MANPPRKKGTGGEVEVIKLLAKEGLTFRRMPAGSTYDLTNTSDPRLLEIHPLEVLATRPDRGEWLFTLRLKDFAVLLDDYGDWETHVEVKRYSRFSLHNIFTKKFGGKA
jgi:hypothetical protein